MTPSDQLIGWPSGPEVPLEVEVFPFDPVQPDARRRNAIRRMLMAMARSPTPMCATCDAELTASAPPSLVFTMAPMFPASLAHQTISGGICPDCAGLEPQTLQDKFLAAARDVWPTARACTPERA